MISKLIAACEGKEFTKACGTFMIVKMTGQYIIHGDNEISDYKMSFIFRARAV